MHDYFLVGLLEAYIKAWVEDVTACLIGLPIKTSLNHHINRIDTLPKVIAGYTGDYEDTLINVYASFVGFEPKEVFKMIYDKGYNDAVHYRSNRLGATCYCCN